MLIFSSWYSVWNFLNWIQLKNTLQNDKIKEEMSIFIYWRTKIHWTDHVSLVGYRQFLKPGTTNVKNIILYNKASKFIGTEQNTGNQVNFTNI